MNKVTRPCKLCGGDLIIIDGPEGAQGKPMVFDASPVGAWYIDDKKGAARSFPSHTQHKDTCTKMKTAT